MAQVLEEPAIYNKLLWGYKEPEQDLPAPNHPYENAVDAQRKYNKARMLDDEKERKKWRSKKGGRMKKTTRRKSIKRKSNRRKSPRKPRKSLSKSIKRKSTGSGSKKRKSTNNKRNRSWAYFLFWRQVFKTT